MTTSRPFVKAANGLVHITDTNLDHDRIAHLADEWRAAEQAKDDDWDARRHTHHDHVTRPAAESAAEDLRDEAGLQMTWQQVLDWIPELAMAAAEARRQQQAEASARINPLLKGA